MRRSLWLIVFGLLLGAVAFNSFEVGGRVGFYVGYNSAGFSADVGNALIGLAALRAQEKGDAKGPKTCSNYLSTKH
jgi:hypothetical protein